MTMILVLTECSTFMTYIIGRSSSQDKENGLLCMIFHAIVRLCMLGAEKRRIFNVLAWILHVAVRKTALG